MVFLALCGLAVVVVVVDDDDEEVDDELVVDWATVVDVTVEDSETPLAAKIPATKTFDLGVPSPVTRS